MYVISLLCHIRSALIYTNRYRITCLQDYSSFLHSQNGAPPRLFQASSCFFGEDLKNPSRTLNYFQQNDEIMTKSIQKNDQTKQTFLRFAKLLYMSPVRPLFLIESTITRQVFCIDSVSGLLFYPQSQNKRINRNICSSFNAVQNQIHCIHSLLRVTFAVGKTTAKQVAHNLRIIPSRSASFVLDEAGFVTDWNNNLVTVLQQEEKVLAVGVALLKARQNSQTLKVFKEGQQLIFRLNDTLKNIGQTEFELKIISNVLYLEQFTASLQGPVTYFSGHLLIDKNLDSTLITISIVFFIIVNLVLVATTLSQQQRQQGMRIGRLQAYEISNLLRILLKISSAMDLASKIITVAIVADINYRVRASLNLTLFIILFRHDLISHNSIQHRLEFVLKRVYWMLAAYFFYFDFYVLIVQTMVTAMQTCCLLLILIHLF